MSDTRRERTDDSHRWGAGRSVVVCRFHALRHARKPANRAGAGPGLGGHRRFGPLGRGRRRAGAGAYRRASGMACDRRAWQRCWPATGIHGSQIREGRRRGPDHLDRRRGRCGDSGAGVGTPALDRARGTRHGGDRRRPRGLADHRRPHRARGDLQWQRTGSRNRRRRVVVCLPGSDRGISAVLRTTRTSGPHRNSCHRRRGGDPGRGTSVICDWKDHARHSAPGIGVTWPC